MAQRGQSRSKKLARRKKRILKKSRQGQKAQASTKCAGPKPEEGADMIIYGV